MENRLIAAILIQAVKDWQKPSHRSEVETFLQSQWFAELTGGIALDTANFRLKLITGQVPGKSIRAAYRNGKIGK